MSNNKDDLGEYMGKFSYPLISKGMAYYNQGRIAEIKIQDGRVFAKVKGSDDHFYDVSISYRNKKYEGDCTCPYCYEHGDCKHIYAVLLYMSKNNIFLDGRQVTIPPSSESQKSVTEKQVPATPKASKPKVIIPKKTAGQKLIDKIEDRLSWDHYMSYKTHTLFNQLYQTKEYDRIAEGLTYLNTKDDIETILNDIDKEFSLEEQKEIFSRIKVRGTGFNQTIVAYIEDHPEKLFFFPISFFQANSSDNPFLTMHLLHVAVSYHYDDLIRIYFNRNIYEDIIDNLFMLNYIKTNFAEDKYLELFKDKIEKYNLSRIEFAFIAPYLDEESKKHLLSMPEGLKFHCSSFAFDSGIEYKNYAYVSPAFVKHYFDEDVMPSDCDLVDMLCFHHFFFEKNGTIAFRYFRSQFNAAIRISRSPNFKLIVPGLLIILEEKDHHPAEFEDTFAKLRQYSVNIGNYKEPVASYLFAKLLSGHPQSIEFMEYKI